MTVRQAQGETATWRIGDRVAVTLPNRANRGRWEAVEGRVAGLDEPDLPRGVRVKFDRLFNEVWDCYATHEELHRA